MCFSIVVGGVWVYTCDYVVYWYYIVDSTLIISVHCHDNMTRAMLSKELALLTLCTACLLPALSRIGSYQAFGKHFTQLLPCTNAYSKLSFNLPFLRCACARGFIRGNKQHTSSSHTFLLEAEKEDRDTTKQPPDAARKKNNAVRYNY